MSDRSRPRERAGWLGVGLGLRRPHLAALRELPDPSLDEPLPVLELTPSHWLARPELVEALAERHAIVLHDVFASLATAGPLDRDHLARVAAFARRVEAVDYTEHLAMTRSPGGLDLGHLIPIPRTRAQLDVLVDHVREARDLLELPIGLELPATTLELWGELDEGAFVSELVERSGCGLHLDLENLRVDARNQLGDAANGRGEPLEAAGALTRDLAVAGVPAELAAPIGRRLSRLPLHAVTRIHLAGGHVDAEGWVVDSHSAPVPAVNLAILASLRSRVRPRAIIIERDADLPSLASLLAEVARAREAWFGPQAPTGRDRGP